MRLTNPTDQNYVRRLLPDQVSSITQSLPILERQEAILIGDAIPVPTIVKIKDLVLKPSSQDIDFQKEWQNDWLESVIAKVLGESG